MKCVSLPTCGVLSLSALFAVNASFAAYYGEWPSTEADLLYAFGFGLLLAWWVHLDRRRRRYATPFEIEAFVLFAWPIVLPCYLVGTRGWRLGPAQSALVALVWYAPYLISDLVYWRFG